MKKLPQLFPYLTAALILVSCSEEAPDPGDSKTSAYWMDGYPKARVGATSIDIDFKPTKNSDVYYLLSDQPLSLTQEEMINEAATPTLPSIKGHGSFSLNANQEGKKTLSNLKEDASYRLYIIVPDSKDTVKNIFLEDIKMNSRQDTSSFFSTSENRNTDYLIYRPEEAMKYPEKKYPIIYFLAGDGEKLQPTKPICLIRNGTLSQYLANGNDVPMMVLSIQHSTDEWNMDLITEGIAHAKGNLPVDESKQYLVGMSAGAFGCWDYAVAHPEEFAAIVPISGGGKNTLACNLKDVAIWAFHNQPDPVVGPSRTITMINDVLACPPTKEVKMLLFPDSGHNCWRRVFDENHSDWAKSPDMERPDIYNWLLLYTKSAN